MVLNHLREAVSLRMSDNLFKEKKEELCRQTDDQVAVRI